MLIKDHDFIMPAVPPEPTRDGFDYGASDVTVNNAANAQGTQSPAATRFENNVLASFSGVIYDPSYGIPPQDSVSDWENASISGYGIIITYEKDGEIRKGRRYKENDDQVEEVEFSPQP